MEDTDERKLFVGGISWDTTDEILKEHFSKYGTVISSVIAKDRNTGTPRGFAFICFSESSAVELALQDSHEILRRMVDVKKAIPRSEQQQSQQQHNRGLSRDTRTNGRSNDKFRTKKIFVGGLSANLTEEEFRSYFEKFGTITDVVIMQDSMTHRPRGFGFITFDLEDSVEDVMKKNFYELNGKLVEVKRAVPKDGISSSNNGSNGRPGGGSGSNFNSYQLGSYPTYNPYYPSGYGNVAGYPYGTGTYGGGYPSGGYGGLGYNLTPIAPRSPWNASAMIGVGGSLLHYGSTTPIYPSYLNGGAGVMGFAVNGYNGILGTGFNGKSAQLGNTDTQGAVEQMPSQTSRGNVDDNFYSSSQTDGAAADKQNQERNDEQFNSELVGISS
ncbi:heterogeneous nuclear ribonucleoprotein 1-like [Olea europaea var. sylvestris]|uniref:heterogeneous nuclear ribonucleoprotein 1-like n=1 Tax=Olea europaea var. sylvestris TaxID=158386 RepID=UPI000C1D7D65|nr:heterogeneous nuclear ribonucleoprotein 1-like [Olea europaea var. sylvestris]